LSRWPTASKTTSARASRTTSSASRSAFTASRRGATASRKGATAPERDALRPSGARRGALFCALFPRLVLVLSALGASACSAPTDVQPFEGDCGLFGVSGWQPNANDEDVPRDLPIRLQLTDYPEPDTVGYDGVVITTGLYYWGGDYAIDLVGKTITFRPSGGLRGGLGYDVHVLPTLRSLRGCAAVKQEISFRTGSGLVPKPPPVPAPATFSDVRKIFARSCAGAACHRASDAAGGGCLDAPAGALSLCDRDAVSALVAVPSRQLTRLQLVVPYDAPRSYLLRKLLPGATPDVPAPTALGHRDPPGAPLSEADLRAVASWIDAGANK
jgi:hypothetical protein